MMPEKTKGLGDHNSYPPSFGTSHVWHCSDGVPKLQLSVDQQLAPEVGSLETQIPATRASHNDHNGCEDGYKSCQTTCSFFQLAWCKMWITCCPCPFSNGWRSHGLSGKNPWLPPAAHFTTTSMHQSSIFNWLSWIRHIFTFLIHSLR